MSEEKRQINQLLRNYSFLVKKELKRIPEGKVGDIEFYNDELKRIDQVLKKGE